MSANVRKSQIAVMLLFGLVGILASAEASPLPPIEWKTPGASAVAAQPAAPQALLKKAADRHVVVQFEQPIEDAQRRALSKSGISLLNYVGSHAYFAKVSAQADGAAAVAKGRLAATFEIDSAWKMHPMIARGEMPEYAVFRAPGPNLIPGQTPANDVETAALYVVFHPDVPLEQEGVAAVARHDGIVRDFMFSINALVVWLPRANIPAFAAEDAVQWIEPPLPPLDAVNDSNRTLTGANIVNAPPYNLDGTGINVLVFDAGTARATHVDFGGRLTVRDTSGMIDHATHVSGTIGGSGAARPDRLYRGMAPGVTIQSYGFEFDDTGVFLYTNPGDLEADYRQAINTYGAEIANNSIGSNLASNGFPCEYEGDYGATDLLIDAIVCGSLGPPGSPYPMRIIWANGNERGNGRCGSDYHTTAPPAGAKNHITVGAVDSNNDAMTFFSSWGPTNDGRLKPDVAAPGCQSNGDNGVTSCSSSSDTAYASKCGTSMATPTVTGLSALILQDWKAHFPGGPLPRNSTLKILLAHNAVDLGNPGPDYQFGFGSVRVQSSIDFLRNGTFIEDSIVQAEEKLFFVAVSAGTASLKATIAWDDPPGAINTVPELVNDLDIVAIAPGGGAYYPWTLDPASPSLPAVRTQPDHRNNIEQVLVDNPTAGNWTIRVTGNTVAQGPQVFSLATSPNFNLATSAGMILLDANRYACDATATVRVSDTDLNANPAVPDTVLATIGSTTQPDPPGQSILLTETGPDSSVFAGPIALSAAGGPGVLQVRDGDTITAIYHDANDGSGYPATVTTTAIVDCRPPIISNVAVTNLVSFQATVTFVTDEPAAATVRFGLTCADLVRTSTDTRLLTAHTLTLSGLTRETTYYFVVDAADSIGNNATDDHGGACYFFATPSQADYFTEQFAGNNDLDNVSVTFTPNGSADFYKACRTPATRFPTDPTEGTVLTLYDDSFAPVTLSSGHEVSLYGTAYSKFYVGSNGYVTFGSGDNTFWTSLTAHFRLPRIAALFDDLYPSGNVSWKQFDDRAAVTFSNVARIDGTAPNSFQIELFYNGIISITYLVVTDPNGLAGLSRGTGLPVDFIASDLSEYRNCMGLAVAPADGLQSSGFWHCAFTPECKTYTLSNSTDAPLNWSATSTQDWVSFSANTGTLDPGGTAFVEACVNANAAVLMPGDHPGAMQFADLTDGSADSRPVVVSVAEPLAVSPSGGFSFDGPEGGPFTPWANTYTLTNQGCAPVDWAGSAAQNWLDVTPNTGTIDPNGSIAVRVSVNDHAHVFPQGPYDDTLTFTNATTGGAWPRSIVLTVSGPPLRPSDPIPADGADGAAAPTLNPVLAWSMGGGFHIWYVDVDNVSGPKNGKSWATAFDSLQMGLAAAQSGDEVWVAEGVYVGAGTAVIKMKNGVALYGGFTGTETSRDQRDWTTHIAVIDGEHARRCVLGANNATLDGFVITHGYTTGQSGGGGMYNAQVSPVVANCTFAANAADYAAGMHNQYGSPVVRDCVFRANAAQTMAGAVMNNYSSCQAVITRCLFEDNTSGTDGAGMHNNNAAAPVVEDCVFRRNGSQAAGGGVFNSGGAAHFARCTFEGNSAVGAGGGMRNSDASPVIEDCTFAGNTAHNGGGMYNAWGNAKPSVLRCTFRENSAGTNGGGMYNDYGTPIVAECAFTANNAPVSGGAVFNYFTSPSFSATRFAENTSGASGGALCDDTSSATFTNCVFWNNQAGSGGGAFHHDRDGTLLLVNCTFAANPAPATAALYNHAAAITVFNCIFWGDVQPEIQEQYATAPASVTYCDIQGGWPGDGNRDADPLFGDAANGNLHLAAADSPCVDAGTSDGAPSVDIAGAPRPQGPGVDMGAYEFPQDPLDLSVATAWRVDRRNVSGLEDGRTWATAFRTIQQAIDAAGTGGDEVWVAEGTYDNPGAQHVFALRKPGIHVYGGFAGWETARDQRNWNVHPVAIDGGQEHRCLFCSADATLDGFTIVNGKAGANFAQYDGGGLYVHDCRLTLQNCIFRDNSAARGGVLMAENAFVDLKSCVCLRNTATLVGGAVYQHLGALTVLHCTFSLNDGGEYYGAIFNQSDSAPAIITNSILWGNLPDQLNPGAGTVTFCDVQGGYPGHGNIDADPRFVDVAHNDLRLGRGSPCINVGTSTVLLPWDLRGIARPQGTAVDMGAYEATSDLPACEMTYDVYLGASNPPLALVGQGLLNRTCNAGLLLPETTYFWQVIARNCYGETPGPVWSFTTMGSPFVVNVTSPHLNGIFPAGEAIPIQVEFSAPVTARGTPTLTLQIGAADRVVDYTSGSDSATLTFTYTVENGDNSPHLDYVGAGALQLNGGSIRDAGSETVDARLDLAPPGSPGSLGANRNIVIDTIPPHVSMASVAPDSTNVSPIPVTVTFSEPVMGFVDTDIRSPYGTVANFSGSDADYRFDFVPNGQGPLTIDIAAGVAIDAARNWNDAAPQFARVYDSIAPTVAMTSGTSDPTNSAAIPILITFSEPVAGFTQDDLVPLNGTIVNFTGSDANYSLDLVPGAPGFTSLDIGAAAAHDAAGNENAAAVAFTRTYDPAPPTATITVLAPDPTNTSPIPVTVTFSEPVRGITDLSMSITNARVSAFSGTGREYRFDLTPFNQGLVIASLPPNTAYDAAGNANTETIQVRRVFDSVAPTGTMSSSAPDPTNRSPIPVRVTFSEPVVDLEASVFQTVNGAVTDFTGSGQDYAFNLAPVGQGTVTVTLPVNTTHDAAQNGIPASLQFNRVYDSVKPVGAMTSPAPDPTSASPIPVSVTFSEPVVNFSKALVSATNATVINFRGSGANYTFDLAPSGQGELIAEVSEGSVFDSAGNTHTPTLRVSRVYDSIAPAVVISSPSLDPTRTAPIPVSVAFSEPVTGFLMGDLAVTNATVANFSGSGADYSFALQPAGQGLVTVGIAAGAAHDAAMNFSRAAEPFRRTFDSIAPTILLASTAPDFTNVAPIPLTITISENVVGFSADSITSTNATVVDFAGDGIHYQFGLAPINQGVVTASIATDSVHDPAGNLCEPTASLSRTYDSAPPTVTISLADPTPTALDVVSFHIEFNEEVGGTFGINDVRWTGWLPATGQIEGQSPVYTLRATLADPDADGTLGLTIVPGGVSDRAGNICSGGASPFYRIHNWIGFTVQPAGAQLYAGDAHRFSVDAAHGHGLISYVWRWDDGGPTVRDVCTTQTYAIPYATTAHHGKYWCEITYDSSSYLSDVVTLDVQDHLEIVAPPEGADKVIGDPYTFHVATRGGYPPLRYSWLKDAAPVGSDSELTFDALQMSDSGAYRVAVSDANADAVQSPDVRLAVTPGVPVAGLLGLGAAIGLCLLAGVAATRKRK